MRHLSLILLMFCIVSCSTTAHVEQIDPTVPYNYIDPKLKPILKMFEYEAHARGIPLQIKWLSMSFGNIRVRPDSNVVGYCQPYKSGRMVIKLHGPSWDFMDDYEQEVLVFHELAHCVLQRMCHNDDVSAKGPVSILNKYVLEGDYYREHREELLDELFDPTAGCSKYSGPLAPNTECDGNNGFIDEIIGKTCPPKDRDVTK